MNRNLMNILENQAKNHYRQKKTEVSFDETTQLVVSNLSLDNETQFKEELMLIQSDDRIISRLDYYYDNILKEVSMGAAVQLTSGEYIDFWQSLEKLSLVKYFLKYQSQTINETNLFGFLSMLKQKIKETKFINNFKLKSIEMIEVKKGFVNGQ